MPLVLSIIAVIVLFVGFCVLIRRSSLAQIRELHQPPEEPQPPEPEIPPSVLRLVTGLVLISVTSIFWLDQNHSFPFLAAAIGIPWGSRRQDRSAVQRQLSGREMGWILLGFAVAIFLVFLPDLLPDYEAPHFERFIKSGTFKATMWVLLCILFVRQWVKLRRKPETIADGPARA